MLNDVSGYRNRDQVAPWRTRRHAVPNVRRGYPHFWGLDHKHLIIRHRHGMPWPGHYNETSEGAQTLRLPPFVDASEGVRAADEEELRSRILGGEIRQGVDRVRHSTTDHVHIRDLQCVIIGRSKSAHLESLLSGRSGCLPFERLSGRRHEEHGVKAESRAHLPGHNEVANVDGIERAPQDADARVSHPGGEYQRS